MDLYAESQFALCLLLFEVVVDEVPVYYLHQGLKIFVSCVSVVDVVGMLPNVYCQKRLITISQRILCVACIDYRKLLVFLAKPSPT